MRSPANQKLIWEDASGKVWLTYNSPEFLRERHNRPPDLMQNVSVVEALAANAAGVTTLDKHKLIGDPRFI